MKTTHCNPLFAPASIAVVGGGNDPAKPGGRVVLNLRQHGFPVLWVVNPKGGEIQGLPTFRTIDDLPEAPDLAILSIQAPLVLEAVDRLLERGTRGLIVLSAGFSETDEAGRILEDRLVARVRKAGGLLVGPNSFGVFTPVHYGIFGGPEQVASPGGIDFVSASGSTACFIMEAGLDRGLRFASLVSLGNSAHLGASDFLAFADEAPEGAPSRVLLLYLESLDEPDRFLTHARSLRRKGWRIAALKAGTTEAGARAAASHTGAMATPDDAISALFDRAGVVRVDSKAAMVDVAAVLSGGGVPRSRDIVIVTHAGGPGILLADELSRQGFRVPELRPSVQQAILSRLSPGSSARNPVDFLASGTAEQLSHILRTLAAEAADELGGVAVVFGSPGLFDVWPAFQVILEASTTLPFPVYPVLPSTRTAAAEMERFRAAGRPFFTDEVALARALGTVVRTPSPAPEADAVDGFDAHAIEVAMAPARSEGRAVLRPDEVTAVLAGAGFRLPRSRIVHDAADAIRFAAEVGGPIVAKVTGCLHKSDHGGVVVGLRSPEEISGAFARLAAFPGADGVLVQEQVSGLEVILGAVARGAFGHTVLVGLGGIFTEALRDVAVGLAPLSREEARRMLGRLRGRRLLDGFRGQAGMDEAVLADHLVRLAELVHRFPGIAEIDVNPLMGRGTDTWAVDARILLGRQD
jgi:acetyltransferase